MHFLRICTTIFLLQIIGKLTNHQRTHETLLRAKYLLDPFIFHITRGRIWFMCSIIGYFNNGISYFILKSLQIKLIVTMKVVFLFKTSKRVDRFSWNACMKIHVDSSEGLGCSDCYKINVIIPGKTFFWPQLGLISRLLFLLTI